jgi:hypothetical protein
MKVTGATGQVSFKLVISIPWRYGLRQKILEKKIL